MSELLLSVSIVTAGVQIQVDPDQLLPQGTGGAGYCSGSRTHAWYDIGDGADDCGHPRKT